jgi:hypothetical protein
MEESIYDLICQYGSETKWYVTLREDLLCRFFRNFNYRLMK